MYMQPVQLIRPQKNCHTPTNTIQTTPRQALPTFFGRLAEEGRPSSSTLASSPAALDDTGDVGPEHDGGAALDRLLGRDRRLEVLDACLPASRALAAGPLLMRGQELVEDNGGTVLALAGPDYCVLAADTRLSSDYRIRTRNVTRLFEVWHSVLVGKEGAVSFAQNSHVTLILSFVHSFTTLPPGPDPALTGVAPDVHGHGGQLGGRDGAAARGRCEPVDVISVPR